MTPGTEHFRQAPEAVGYGFNISESSSSNVDDRALHELYAWPFADAVRAGVGAIMCVPFFFSTDFECITDSLQVLVQPNQ